MGHVRAAADWALILLLFGVFAWLWIAGSAAWDRFEAWCADRWPDENQLR